eukprot:1709479-Rhodomonas_salina.1
MRVTAEIAMLKTLELYFWGWSSNDHLVASSHKWIFMSSFFCRPQLTNQTVPVPGVQSVGIPSARALRNSAGGTSTATTIGLSIFVYDPVRGTILLRLELASSGGTDQHPVGGTDQHHLHTCTGDTSSKIALIPYPW